MPPVRKSVLIVQVEQPHLPWVAGFSSGLFATFEAEPPATRPEVHSNYLESVRLPDRAPAEVAWFRQRYRGEHFDVIVAVTNGALDFLKPLRDELWPGVPVVLLTPRRGLDEIALPPGVVALGAAFEVEKTLDLVKAVLPETRHVAYVSEDGSDNERLRRDLSERGLDLVDLTGLRLEELEKRIADLPPQTAVFFESFHADGSGRQFVPRDVLARVAPLSNAPIFGVSATYLGRGLLGGWVLDYREFGVETAHLVLRILGGEPVPTVPASSTFSRLEFDDRELRRWRIPSSRVPAAAQILHQSPSLWRDHTGVVLAAVGALLFQGALIAALLLERRRRSEAQGLTDATIASLPNEVAVLDGSGRIIEVNENWARSGLHSRSGTAGSAPVGANYLELCRQELADGDETAARRIALIESILDGSRTRGELEYGLGKAGEERWFEKRVQVLGSPGRGAVIVNVDVTERRLAESEARRHHTEIAHLNRVAAMGELASSLAHELNQPLTAILTNAQAARRLLARPSPDLAEIGASLNDIVEDDQRAGDVIHRMRALLRKEESRVTAVDLNDAVRRVVRLVSSDAHLRKATITVDPAAGLPAVSGDGVQLQQVILNLVVNGLDAVAERPPDQRRVEIRTSAGNGRVAVTVSDSGRGIPAEDEARVFEPFFTTKAHGLGMGLAICRSIVDAHVGRLIMRSAAGGGAEFECEFPALQAHPA